MLLNIGNDFAGIIASAVVGFIFAQYLIPVTEKITDNIKTSNGPLGNFYKKYYNTIGKYLFLTKKLDSSLSKRKFEYKIYINNDTATCYCSKITEIRQNYFNSINGKVNRVGVNENYESFFKGNINNTYLQWAETSNQESAKKKIYALYDLGGNPKNIVGSSVEVSNRIIDTPICVLSKEPVYYNTLKELIDDTPILKEKLKNINTSSKIKI